MNASSTHARRRGGLLRTAGWLSAAAMLALSAFAPSVQAASVVPTPINEGNPTCADFNAGWIQVKVEPPGNGTFGDGTLSVTITNFQNSSGGTPGSFDWSSNIGVDAVFVKAGSDKHNLYVYDPESTGDTDLGPQSGTGNGISHISFCYDEDGEPSTPPSTPPSNPPTNPPTGSEEPASSESTQPSGEVGGVVGTPNVTPPATDAAIGDRGASSATPAMLVAAAMLLIVILMSIRRPARRRR
jgi:hypothetical protein